MATFYVETTSFANPKYSEKGGVEVEAEDAKAALLKVAAEYDPVVGLYAAQAYSSADARNNRQRPLAVWICNHELKKSSLTRGINGHMYFGHGPGDFEINGVRHTVENPKEGQVF